jgi:menaquinone-dependent protoporphyrinogen IX oxidase
MGGIANVFDVRENPDLAKYDHLIIGSAIRSSKITPELQAYLEKNRPSIGAKVRGVYTVCGNMQKPVTPELTKQQITDYLAPMCGAKDAIGHVFLGRVTPRLLPPDIREQMKMAGDYDNLKRPDCMAFGAEILSRIQK